MNELYILGDVDLRGTDGNRVDSIVAQPKSLALLAYLCLSARGRPLKRDLLISMFWPELSEPNARNALNQSLHRLRHALGPETIASHGTIEVGVDQKGLSCDALDFLDALGVGELESALDLYGGDLLAGMFVSGSPDFERWLDGERSSFRKRAFEAALKLGQAAETADDLASASRWYQRAMVIIPERGTAVRHLMTVLAGTGNAVEAVQLFDRFAARLAEDYGLQPSEETRAVVQSIRSSANVNGEAQSREKAKTQRATAEEIPAPLQGVQTGQSLDASGPGSSSPWRVGVSLFLGAAVVTAGALLVSGGWPGRGPLQITTSNLTHVTSEPGVEFQPAISPDGSEVAYVEGPIGSPRIVVRSALELGTGESRPGADAGGKHWFPTWMPGGASLRFWSCEDQFYVQPGCEWMKAGSRGGPALTVGVPRLGHYAWSQDGSRVAFAVGDSIFAYTTDGGESELLGVHTVDSSLPHSLAWSPDGELIAYVNGNSHWRTSANVAHASIWILDAKGGEPIPVTDEEHLNVSPQWLPNSRHLLFVSDRDGSRGIYVVEVGSEGPIGTARSVPGASDPHSISVSADGRKLAYARFADRQNIWSIPIPDSGSISLRDDLGDAIPITTGNQVIERFSLSPDGEWIAFDSYLQGKFGIYKQPLSGGAPQLVVDITGNAFEPSWSPDGSEFAFHSNLSTGTGSGGEVWVASVDGGALEQLTDSHGQDSRPTWSPDGLAIAFDSESVRWSLWMVSRDSVGMPWSEPVQLTDFSCPYHDWTPDGNGVLCLRRDEVTVVSREGDILAHLPKPAGMVGMFWPEFSPDGSRVYFRGTHEDGSTGIWWISANGGDATQVVAFDDPSISVFGTNVGEEHFYLAFSEYESDIWVMDLDW